MTCLRLIRAWFQPHDRVQMRILIHLPRNSAGTAGPQDDEAFCAVDCLQTHEAHARRAQLATPAEEPRTRRPHRAEETQRSSTFVAATPSIKGSSPVRLHADANANASATSGRGHQSLDTPTSAPTR
jgi:hypothetical protein